MDFHLAHGGRLHIGVGFFGAMACAVAASSGPLAAEQVRPVPLGGSVEGQLGEAAYGVYVPTRHGGTLSVHASSGEVVSLAGPDGKPRTNGREVGGTDAH